ncbi:mechanosensitive ion channel family protein, partial [Candidatus Peregrinibacteria bacterium]|nr:mechanosensitive ion channel family protein [Candidatus Peregrinibacteria bacterium]
SLSIGVFFGVIIVVKLIEVYILHRFERLAEKTTTDVDDFLLKLVRKLGWPLYFVLAMFFAMKTASDIPEKTALMINYATVFIGTLYALKISSALVDYGIEKSSKKTTVGLKTFTFFIKFAVWSFILVLVLSNLGYNLTSIITGLGIGGIAIGLALQNVLGDFFSGIIILFDKPFEIGDYIKVGEFSGTVRSIGVKTTRITLLDGQELVITNKDLTESRVHNFKKLKKRRKAITLGLTYDTSLAKLKKVPALIEKAFKGLEKIELDRVHLVELASSSKNFEIIYYINSENYKFYLDQNEKLLLKIIETFEKEKIEFAFPTRTIHIEK